MEIYCKQWKKVTGKENMDVKRLESFFDFTEN